MKYHLHILFITILACCSLAAQAQSTYSTVYNSFASLQWQGKATLADKVLQCHNATASPLLMLDTTAVTAGDYRFYARLLNQHNAEGKRYWNAGKKRDFTEAGIVFCHKGDGDYWTATLHAFNSHPHDDMLDQHLMCLSVKHLVGGKAVFQRDTALTHGFDLRGGYNVLGVDMKDSQTTILAGDNHLNPIFTLDVGPQLQPVHMGVLVGSGALINLERTVLALRSDSRINTDTGWTRDSLDAHFAHSRDLFEGYWQYLDRDMQDTWLRLGGRYTLAIVKSSENTYDIIYVSGAEVKDTEWHCGMLKGRLEKTIFPDTYKAQWIDATHRSMGRDVQASVEQGIILTLKFPVWNSSVRFSKFLRQ